MIFSNGKHCRDWMEEIRMRKLKVTQLCVDMAVSDPKL